MYRKGQNIMKYIIPVFIAAMLISISSCSSKAEQSKVSTADNTRVSDISGTIQNGLRIITIAEGARLNIKVFYDRSRSKSGMSSYSKGLNFKHRGCLHIQQHSTENHKDHTDTQYRNKRFHHIFLDVITDIAGSFSLLRTLQTFQEIQKNQSRKRVMRELGT